MEHGKNNQRTFFKGLLTFIIIFVVLLFFLSVGVVQKLLSWNTSVFLSSIVMIIIMIFYARRIFKNSLIFGTEKDAFDAIRKWFVDNSDGHNLLFHTEYFFEKSIGVKSFGNTMVADYFRQLGNRISSIELISAKYNTDRNISINLQDQTFCFFADTERIIKPMVSSGGKLLMFGLIGTVSGIMIMSIGTVFGETASQVSGLALNLIVGVGVATFTTLMGLIGRLFIGSYYEQHDDVRDRILSELHRITLAQGLDLYAVNHNDRCEEVSNE